MGIKSDEHNGVRVLGVEGDFAGDTCAAFRRFVDEHAGAGRANLFVVDLAKSSFVDSDGLESLLALKRRAEDCEGRVKLAGANAHFRKILEVTRLAHRFECHSDLPAALKAMR